MECESARAETSKILASGGRSTPNPNCLAVTRGRGAAGPSRLAWLANSCIDAGHELIHRFRRACDLTVIWATLRSGRSAAQCVRHVTLRPRRLVAVHLPSLAADSWAKRAVRGVGLSRLARLAWIGRGLQEPRRSESAVVIAAVRSHPRGVTQPNGHLGYWPESASRSDLDDGGRRGWIMRSGAPRRAMYAPSAH